MLVGYRLRLFTLADELGSRGVPGDGRARSTYYRWKDKVDRWGLEALNVRERRRPRMPNQIGPHLEQRIVAFSLAHPGFGPRRISAELAREKWGGLRISEHGVWRVLRVGLNPRKRLALIAGTATPTSARHPCRPGAAHRRDEARRDRQMDCFFIGRLSGSKGTVWQYTAIDVASGYTWAELHTSERNPAPATPEPAPPRRAELALAGWKLRAVTTDNGSEFRAKEFADGRRLGAQQRRINAGRPTSNGCVERVQLTILEECWRPASPAHSPPRSPRSKRPRRVPRHYNTDRAHTGRHTRPRPRRHRLRCPQDGAAMTTCRHNSGIGQPSGCREGALPGLRPQPTPLEEGARAVRPRRALLLVAARSACLRCSPRVGSPPAAVRDPRGYCRRPESSGRATTPRFGIPRAGWSDRAHRSGSCRVR